MGGLEMEDDSQVVEEPEFNPGVADCKDAALSTHYSSTHSFNTFIFYLARAPAVVPGAGETEINDTGMALSSCPHVP